MSGALLPVWKFTYQEYHEYLLKSIKKEKPQNRFWMPKSTLDACMEADRLSRIKIYLDDHYRRVEFAIMKHLEVPQKVIDEHNKIKGEQVS